MPFKDKDRARAYFKEYNSRRKITEEYKEKKRAYYLAHKEERRAYERANQHKYRAARKSKRIAMPPLVYVWFDSEGVADWVGRGTIERVQRHKHKTWYTNQHLLITMTCKNEWEAMEYEGRWGNRYKPRYNIEGYRR